MTVIDMKSKKAIESEESKAKGTSKETTPKRDQALYSIESIYYSQLALLTEKAKTTEGLNEKDWKRLKDIMKVISTATDIELNTTKKSVLEGLTDDEVLELVEEAKRKLANE